jgi:hypothetical protein
MLPAHAAIRAQQRGIPPLIRDWLFQFGEEQHDGHGAIRRFFSQRKHAGNGTLLWAHAFESTIGLF